MSRFVFVRGTQVLGIRVVFQSPNIDFPKRSSPGSTFLLGRKAQQQLRTMFNSRQSKNATQNKKMRPKLARVVLCPLVIDQPFWNSLTLHSWN